MYDKKIQNQQRITNKRQKLTTFPNFFHLLRIWSINRVKDAAYLCDLRLELEVRPLRYVVTTSSLERWMSSQLPVVVRQVVARSIELDQVRLRAPRFLPALEATFGARIGGDNRREGRRYK